MLSPCHEAPLELRDDGFYFCTHPMEGKLRKYDKCYGLFVIADGAPVLHVPLYTDEERELERQAWLNKEGPRGLDKGELTEVDTRENGKRSITFAGAQGDREYGGYSFGGIPSVEEARKPVEIEVGSKVRIYGGGLGNKACGLDVWVEDEGYVNVWFETPLEQRQDWVRWLIEHKAKKEADFEASRDELDARYEALPEVMRKRIDKYRTNNPKFRVDFESYEMMCLEEAIKFAEFQRSRYEELLADRDALTDFIAESITDPEERQETLGGMSEWDDDRWRYAAAQQVIWREFYDDRDLQKKAGVSGDHSGNTFGAACSFACLYLSGLDEGLVGHYGALAPLVGSDEYGDVPKEEVTA